MNTANEEAWLEKLASTYGRTHLVNYSVGKWTAIRRKSAVTFVRDMPCELAEDLAADVETMAAEAAHATGDAA